MVMHVLCSVIKSRDMRQAGWCASTHPPGGKPVGKRVGIISPGAVGGSITMAAWRNAISANDYMSAILSRPEADFRAWFERRSGFTS
jgi:hypothetical protein